MRFCFFIFLMLLSLGVRALDSSARAQVLERIKPIGQVHLASKTGSFPATTDRTMPKETPGQAIYEKHCSVCHRDGLAGAPKYRVSADWHLRLNKNINELVAVAIKGVNAMPAKGTCMDCSDQELKQAIQFMLPQS